MGARLATSAVLAFVSIGGADDVCPCARASRFFRFFVHPSEFTVLSKHYQHIYETLLAHPARTFNASEAACIFLGIDVGCEQSWPHRSSSSSGNYVIGDGAWCYETRKSRLQAYLDKLITKKTGYVPHVIFDMSRSRAQVADIPRSPSVILASTNIDKHTYRPGTDISLPVMLEGHGTQHIGFTGMPVHPVCSTSRRHLLLSYRGPDSGLLPEGLSSLHNGVDVVFELTLEEGLAVKEESVVQVAALLTSSSFVLIPRSSTPPQSRIAEAVCNGAVPVILADSWQLPFAEVGGANYSEFAVRLAPDEWPNVIPLLRGYSNETLCRLYQGAIRACHQHFSTFRAQVDTMLKILAMRTRQEVAQQPVMNTTDTEPTERPTWTIGPWITYNCGERYRISSTHERQDCQRCVSGSRWPVCIVGNVQVPQGTSLPSIRESFNVDGPCMRYDGRHNGCECVQMSKLASTDFSLWGLSAACKEQAFARWFDCDPQPHIIAPGGPVSTWPCTVNDTKEAVSRAPSYCSSGGVPVRCS